MRHALVALAVLVPLAGCAGYHSRPDEPGLAYVTPPPGVAKQVMSDGFYDGGVDDHDLSPTSMPLPE